MLSEEKNGLKISEMKQLLNIDKSQVYELLSHLEKNGLAVSEYGERYKITMDGRIYLGLLTASKNDSLTILKNLNNTKPSILTKIKQIAKSVLNIVLKTVESIIAKILTEKFFK